MDPIPNKQMTPYISPSWASQGMSFMITLEKHGEIPAMCQDIRNGPFSCFCCCYGHTNATNTECISTGTTWWVGNKTP